MKSSVSAGLLEEQSASFPGRLEISKPDFLTSDFSRTLGSTRALAARIPFFYNAFCNLGILHKEIREGIAEETIGNLDHFADFPIWSWFVLQTVDLGV